MPKLHHNPDDIYSVQLLCPDPSDINVARIIQSVSKRCPELRHHGGDGASNLVSFTEVHQNCTYKPPVQFFVSRGALLDINSDAIQSAFDQSWGFDSCKDQLSNCSHAIVVSDLFASSQDYKQRAASFQRFLRAVLDAIDCSIIHWPASNQFVDPANLCQSIDKHGYTALRPGLLNVRFYRDLAEDELETPALLMDTAGLTPIGLPDIQCHFKSLDPKLVSSVIYDTAHYLFENGDIIEDGHSVRGVFPEDKWICQMENSIAPPIRTVIDLNPGLPWAAGERTLNQ